MSSSKQWTFKIGFSFYRDVRPKLASRQKSATKFWYWWGILDFPMSPSPTSARPRYADLGAFKISIVGDISRELWKFPLQPLKVKFGQNLVLGGYFWISSRDSDEKVGSCFAPMFTMFLICGSNFGLLLKVERIFETKTNILNIRIQL